MNNLKKQFFFSSFFWVCFFLWRYLWCSMCTQYFSYIPCTLVCAFLKKLTDFIMFMKNLYIFVSYHMDLKVRFFFSLSFLRHVLVKCCKGEQKDAKSTLKSSTLIYVVNLLSLSYDFLKSKVINKEKKAAHTLYVY